MLHDDTASSSLGRVLGVGQCSADDLYRALDWLHDAQPAIERRLARQHLAGSHAGAVRPDLDLADGTLLRAGRARPFARRQARRSADRLRPDLHGAEGCPIAVEVFAGNTADPATVAAQVAKLRERFGIEHIVWVGDRGMLTSARIEQVLKPAGHGLGQQPARAADRAAGRRSTGRSSRRCSTSAICSKLSSEHFPGERLVVCRNPLLAEERARKRGELLAATEADLAKIAAATQRARQPLRGEQAIALRVGRVIERFHMAKHFELSITDDVVRPGGARPTRSPARPRWTGCT